jgi:hypothetical protein
MDITKQNKINLISIYMSWQNKLLKEIYYNPKTGFKSQNRLYKEALKQDQRIRHNDVDSFLKKQEENQMKFNTFTVKPQVYKPIKFLSEAAQHSQIHNGSTELL